MQLIAMEAMNLVEVVLNHGQDDENDKTNTNIEVQNGASSPIKGLDESVSITVSRTPGRPVYPPRLSGKPANFAMLSLPARNARNSDGLSASQREEMVCQACKRVFKYKAAFIRHEAQCGLPAPLKAERAAMIEAQRAERMIEVERRKIEEKHEKQVKTELRCPICLKHFNDAVLFKLHNIGACAAERASYTFVCSVCNARFKYKNHMRRHEDSHNNVRRFNCEVCTTAFLRPDHLKRHMMRMHGIVQSPVQCAPKNAPMQCPMCSKVLSRRDHLLRHMRNVHHMNYSQRKRTGISGQGLEGPIDLQGNNFYQDDEDESENTSLTSHDGLMIDESFESTKRGSGSRSPDDCEDSSNISQRGSLSDFKSEVNLLNQLNGTGKMGSPSMGMVVNIGRGGDPNSESRFKSQYSSNYGENIIKREPELHGKNGEDTSSDGNQNVMSNGHSADWMSDFAPYGSW